LSGESESFCCRGGKITIAPLPALPELWEEMLQRPAFRNHSQHYNNLFAFTAMGVMGDQGLYTSQPQAVSRSMDVPIIMLSLQK